MTRTQEENEKLLTLFTPGRCARHPMPPLQYAVYNVWYGGTGDILALLAAGAELDAADENGRTALHQAVFEDEPAVYALLAQAGADQQVPDRFGKTPAGAFERAFGMPCEEKFKGVTVDADYFRKGPADPVGGASGPPASRAP